MKFPIKFNNDIVIRPITKTDALGMMNFANLLVDEKVDINRTEKITLKKEVEWINDKLKDKKSVLLVAIKGSEIIGSTVVGLGKGKSAHIGHMGIGIAKDYRRIGLGKALMSSIIKLAQEKLKGLEVIEAEVFVRNKASRGLLKKMGFKKVGKIKKRFKFEGQYYDGLIVHKWLE